MEIKNEDLIGNESPKEIQAPQETQEQPAQVQPQSQPQPIQVNWQEMANRLSHIGIANLEKISLLQQIILEQRKTQDILIELGKKLLGKK